MRIRLGWIAIGRLPAVYREDAVYVNHICVPSDDALHAQADRFWTTGSLGTNYRVLPRRSKKDEEALETLEGSILLRFGHYGDGLLGVGGRIALAAECVPRGSRRPAERVLARPPS